MYFDRLSLLVVTLCILWFDGAYDIVLEVVGWVICEFFIFEYFGVDIVDFDQHSEILKSYKNPVNFISSGISFLGYRTFDLVPRRSDKF